MNKYSRSDPPSRTAFPIDRAGYPYIFVSAFVTAVFALLGITGLAVGGLLVSFFIGYFFRDPDRVIPTDENAVVSPADGKVIAVESLNRSEYYEGQCKKVSIFMTVFNVHVNRMVYEGTITNVSYFPGKFFSANLDKASKENEHNAVFIETRDGKKLCMVQIAGLVARRIICKIQPGDELKRGERFGIICFGSRVDVYLPEDTKIKVTPGEKVAAGTSKIGELA